MKAQGQSKSGALSTAAATRSRGATSASRATDAPRVVAQRKQFQSMFGGAIQRKKYLTMKDREYAEDE